MSGCSLGSRVCEKLLAGSMAEAEHPQDPWVCQTGQLKVPRSAWGSWQGGWCGTRRRGWDHRRDSSLGCLDAGALQASAGVGKDEALRRQEALPEAGVGGEEQPRKASFTKLACQRFGAGQGAA